MATSIRTSTRKKTPKYVEIVLLAGGRREKKPSGGLQILFTAVFFFGGGSDENKDAGPFTMSGMFSLALSFVFWNLEEAWALQRVRQASRAFLGNISRSRLSGDVLGILVFLQDKISKQVASGGIT